MSKRLFYTLLLCSFVLPATLLAAQEPTSVIEDAVADLSGRLGQPLTLRDFANWTWAEEIYPDTSLGCPQEGQQVTEAITRGYILTFTTYDGMRYDYRAPRAGDRLLLCASYAVESPPPGIVEDAESDRRLVTVGPITAENVGLVTELARLNTDANSTALMAWSAAENLIGIAGGGEQGGVWLYPADNLDRTPTRINTDQPVTALAFAQSDSASLFVASELNGIIRLLPVDPDRSDPVVLAGMTQAANDIALNRDWSLVAAASGEIYLGEESDNAVYLWDARTGALLATLEHDEPVGSVAFSPSGVLLAAGDQKGAIHLWRITTGSSDSTVSVSKIDMLEGQSDMIRDLAFTPDRRLLASGSMDGTVWLWDLAERRALNRLDDGSEDAVITLTFSPDGQVLASAGGNPNASNPDNTIRLWDTLSGELLNTLEGHTTTVGSLTFSPQGELLASAGDDRSVRLWGVSAFARG